MHASNPTRSVTPTQIHAMAFSVRMGRTDRLDYRFKDDIPHEQWSQYDSFVVLQGSPEFSVTGAAGENTKGIDGSPLSGFEGGAETRTESDPRNASHVEGDMIHDDGGTNGECGTGGSGRNELRSADGGGSSANSGNVEGVELGSTKRGTFQEAEDEMVVAKATPQFGARQRGMRIRRS